MKKISIFLIASILSIPLTSFAAQTDVDRQQLKTQIEIRNIQMERYKMERQMMLDINSLKTQMSSSPSERAELEKKFPVLSEESNSRKALLESRNAD